MQQYYSDCMPWAGTLGWQSHMTTQVCTARALRQSWPSECVEGSSNSAFAIRGRFHALPSQELCTALAQLDSLVKAAADAGSTPTNASVDSAVSAMDAKFQVGAPHMTLTMT
jgi:hypothetical protein